MTTLKSLVDETTNIKNEIVECHSNLSSILTSKNVEVSEEDKMSDLIDKVGLLGDVPPPPLYLYKEGNECVDVTGGWTTESYNSTTSFALDKSSSNMSVTVTGAGKAQICTTNIIDLSKYSKLYFDVNPRINSDYAIYRYGVINVKTDSIEGKAIAATAASAKGKRTVFEVNVSKINSAVYVGIYTQRNGGSTVIHDIYNVWLEH